MELMVPHEAQPAGAAALPPALERWVRTGVWLLPVWALCLAASTVTHQPDFEGDFGGYARYVTTTPFLISHVVLSIVGAALGAVGALALSVRLASSPAARTGLWGASAFAASQVLTASVFGVAAFFQPAIGRAYLDGTEATAESINLDVYGPELFATVGAALVLMTVGAALIGRAAVRSALAPTWAGRVLIWGVPLFIVAGFSMQMLQPVVGLVLAAGTVTLVRPLSSPVRREAHR